MGDALKGLLNKAEALNALQTETQHASKRSRPSSLDIFPSLCDALNRIPSREVIEASGGKVEIEVRVGMLVEGTRRMHSQMHAPSGCYVFDHLLNNSTRAMGYLFKSGIDEEFVDKLKKSFVHEKFKEIKQPLQILHIDAQHNRWEVKENSECVLYPEKKTRFSRLDMALLSYDYDIRVDGAMENPLDTKSNTIDMKKWVMKRIKKRSTYKLDSKAFWHIDLTEVESIHNPFSSNIPSSMQSEMKEIELEFELEEEAVKVFLSLPDRIEMIRAMAAQLLRLLDLCIPCNINIPLDQTILKIEDHSSGIVSQVNSITRTLLGDVHSRLEFIGAMPVNISRRNLQHILKNNYFITEKSDGSRKLLYVVKDPISGSPMAVVCDRGKHIEKLDGCYLLGSALKLGTVLDGELVFNLSIQKYVFLVFDILSDGNENVMHLLFQHRFSLLQKEILPRVQTAIQSGLPEQVCTHLVLKSFVNKRKIQELLSKIKLMNGHRIYFDRESEGRRHHRTDGLIFQPDTSYCVGTDMHLIKWKYEDLMSVDLLVVEDQSAEIKLMCAGPEDMTIDCTKKGAGNISFGTFSNYRLKADLYYLKQFEPTKPRIAEVAYNPHVGVWAYFHFREDKIVPNQIHTVMSVFMEQAEGIDVEELEYRLLARTEAENDFSTQMLSMKAKALDFQRKRTA